MFLDRDGVLNRPNIREGRSFAPRTLEDFELLPGVVSTIAAFRAAGLLSIVVTNQKDVGTGDLDPEILEAMHQRLMQDMPIDAIYVCTCVDECPCYKPNPGMLLEAAEEHGIDLDNSVMVGDRWRDVGAGKRAGCKTVFIDWEYDEVLQDSPDFVAKSLPHAQDWILEQLASGPQRLL